MTRQLKQYQKLIGLFTALCIVSFIHVNLRSNTQLQGNYLSHSAWAQPEVLNSRYPQLIGDSNWRISFTKIEPLISTTSTDNAGELIINPDMVERLRQITALLPSEMPEAEQQRLGFLIEQSVGSSVGQAFTNLIRSYIKYQQEYQSLIHKLQESGPDRRQQFLRLLSSQIQQAQVRHFGAGHAQQLFKQENLTTEYIHSRQIIHLQKNLSQSQKNAALSKLKEDYHRSINEL